MSKVGPRRRGLYLRARVLNYHHLNGGTTLLRSAWAICPLFQGDHRGLSTYVNNHLLSSADGSTCRFPPRRQKRQKVSLCLLAHHSSAATLDTNSFFLFPFFVLCWLAPSSSVEHVPFDFIIILFFLISLLIISRIFRARRAVPCTIKDRHIRFFFVCVCLCVYRYICFRPRPPLADLPIFVLAPLVLAAHGYCGGQLLLSAPSHILRRPIGSPELPSHAKIAFGACRTLRPSHRAGPTGSTLTRPPPPSRRISASRFDQKLISAGRPGAKICCQLVRCPRSNGLFVVMAPLTSCLCCVHHRL